VRHPATWRAIACVTVAACLVCQAREVAVSGQAPAEDGPRRIAERFYRLDADGARLDPSSRAAMSPLVTGELTPPLTVALVDSYFVNAPAESREPSIQVFLEYTPLGTIDPRTARLRRDGAGASVRGLVTMTRSGQAWTIDASSATAILSVSAARKYLSVLRSRTPDAAVKKEAARTLDALRGLRSK
jgi:hypothetical protein